VTFEEFERLAHEVFDEIPAVYRDGIDGLTVRPDAPAHPDHPDVYTLGECLTEEHVSDFGSAETTRSVIALYWGSFRALASRYEDFDWEGELWETLTHELRHHLESLAGDDALEGVDYAADQSFKRFDGQDFDPWYYQYGDEVDDGLYRVEKTWYLEVPAPRDPIEEPWIDFEWRDRRYRIRAPGGEADVHFVLVDGVDTTEAIVEVVVVRRPGWWKSVARLLGASRPIVEESEARAVLIDSDARRNRS